MILQRAINARRCLSLLTMKRCMSETPQIRQNIDKHTPNGPEKYFLVWTGKYKSVKDVPQRVNSDVMERCRNRMRIRIANIMMLLTVVGICISVYSGKEAAKRGETVVKQNLDWHKEYNAKFANKEGKQ